MLVLQSSGLCVEACDGHQERSRRVPQPRQLPERMCAAQPTLGTLPR